MALALCKQGVAGSIPATSTNHHHFNEMPSEFSCVTTCYTGRGREFECPHAHQLNSCSHIDLSCFSLGTFWCKLGTSGTREARIKFQLARDGEKGAIFGGARGCGFDSQI